MHKLTRRMGQALQSNPERWMHTTQGRAAQAGYSKAEVESRTRLTHLYDVLSTSFGKDCRPSQQDIRQLCGAIEAVPLADLGISIPKTQEPSGAAPNPFAAMRTRASTAAALSAAATAVSNVTYLPILEDGDVTICIFQLGQGARIPLHNHPGMTVFSRLLYGSLHVRSYDWMDDDQHSAAPAGECADDSSSTSSNASMTMAHPGTADSSSSGAGGQQQGGGSPPPQQQQEGLGGVRLARLVSDQVITAPAPISVLFPQSGGNIHAFTAITPCAILDVLTPPYAPASGRDCTYYKEQVPPELAAGADGQPLLVPTEQVSLFARYCLAKNPDQPLDVVLRRLNSCCASEPAAAGGGGGGGGGGGVVSGGSLAGVHLAGAVVPLAEVETPAWFSVESGSYKGERITPNPKLQQQRQRSGGTPKS